MTKSEQVCGLFYLMFELLFLPSVLTLINSAFSHPADQAILNFVYFGINFLAVLFIFRNFLQQSLHYAVSHWKQILLTALIGFGCYWVINIAVSWVLTLIFPGFSNANDQAVAGMLRQHFLVMTVGTVILVPPVEEMLHRGLIFGQLRQKSRVLAYAVSAFVFALIHVAGYLSIYDFSTLIACFIQYLPAGILFAFVYEESGSVFTSMLMHAAINALGIYLVR